MWFNSISVVYLTEKNYRNIYLADSQCVYDFIRWMLLKQTFPMLTSILTNMNYSMRILCVCEPVKYECCCCLFHSFFFFVFFSFLLFYCENNCIRTKWHNCIMNKKKWHWVKKMWNAATPSPHYQSDGLNKRQSAFSNTMQRNAMESGWKAHCWKKHLHRMDRKTPFISFKRTHRNRIEKQKCEEKEKRKS